MRTDLLPWLLLAAINIVALNILWQTGWWLYRPDGDPWTHDYIAQWAAGHRVLAGEAGLVYDWAEHAAYQARLIGARDPVELYVFYPPHFLFTTPVFAWLGHVPASLAFLAVTAAAYAAALRPFLGSWARAALVALSGGGAFYCIWWTQNGFLTAALLTAGLVALKDRPALAGLFFGLLTIKPQLGLLVPVALLFSGNWRAIASAAATFASLAFAAELVFGSGIWANFIASIGETSAFLQSGNLWFKQQSLFALTYPFYGPAVAWAVQALLALVIAAIVAWMWSRPGSYWTKCSALVSGTLLATPYLYPYDAVPLTAAAAMLLYGESRRRLSGLERLLVILCCLLPMGSRFIFSAAVPLAALVLLFIAVRQYGRNGNEKGSNVSPVPSGR